MAELSLCVRCGVFVPGRRQCPDCAHPLPRPTLVPPAAAARFVRAAFEVRCGACGEDTPVLRPDATQVECASCAEAIALEPQGVARVLRFAHGVALRPPSTHAEDRRDFGLAVDARRGHPCCEACVRPLVVRAQETPAASFALVCEGCGVVWEAWPARRATEACPALRALLPASPTARDEAGRSLAQGTSSRSGARLTALVCPSCAAALPAPDADTGLAACAYCRTLSLVRSEPVVRSEAPPAHVWLAFDERTPGTASGRSGA